MEDLQRGHAQLERVDLTISVLFHIIRKSHKKNIIWQSMTHYLGNKTALELKVNQ